MSARQLPRSQLRWLWLALLLAPPPAATAADDSEEWQNDRQAPFAGAGWTTSQGGSPSVSFPSSGVDLLSWVPLLDFDASTTAANDIWGYTSPSGREYALIGLSLGTGIVEVTEPDDAQIVGLIAGPTSSWRDIKTYQRYAYVVSEAGNGIQVLDLTQIDSGTVTLANTVTTGGRTSTHDVALNPVSGRLYRVGGGGNSPPLGLRIYSLATPALPVLVGQWNDRYCHDAQVVSWTEPPYAGVEVAFCFANDTTNSGNPGVEILDVSNPASISVIGSINLSLPPIFSHKASYSHQGWLSPDRHYLYFDDEVDEAANGSPTTTRILDVSDLTSPTQVATFSNGNSARDHNLFTLGQLIFEANYRSGLRVFDASNPLAPFETAYFDTYPDDDKAKYNGLWGVYPYFSSGTIVGSDIEKGLFVWRLTPPKVASLSLPGLLGTIAAILAMAFLAHRNAGAAARS
jgi:choice-of-anchor B domain-containing protein